MTTSSSGSSGAFAGLVKPMVETVDRRGLKKRFLGKHRIFVDRFYKRLNGGFGAGEAARKIIERLQKNRNTMFTFLDFDDVPWNNNNAEHAVKAFAIASPRHRWFDHGKRPSRLFDFAEPMRDV